MRKLKFRGCKQLAQSHTTKSHNKVKANTDVSLATYALAPSEERYNIESIQPLKFYAPQPQPAPQNQPFHVFQSISLIQSPHIRPALFSFSLRSRSPITSLFSAHHYWCKLKCDLSHKPVHSILPLNLKGATKAECRSHGIQLPCRGDWEKQVCLVSFLVPTIQD